MSALSTKSRLLTEAEYLAQEELAEFKSEFYKGEVFAMSGATATHSELGVRLGYELINALDDRPCKVYSSDTKIKISATGLYTYPDTSVTCDSPQFGDPKRMVLLNPQMVCEVLSNSTEAYDRGEKFTHYESLPSLKAYVLVSQWEHQVEVFWRTTHADAWNYLRARGIESQLTIPSMNLTLRLAEIYKGVELAPRPVRVLAEE